MDLNQLASDLFGSKRAESGTTPSTVSVMYGIATSDSADGMVSVWLSDNALSPSAAQTEWETVDSYDADAYEGMDESTSIEIPTEVTVFKDDVVRVQLVGAGAAKNPTVVGVVGRGDEETERLKAIEVDYVKATTLEADVAQIGFLKADSAVITNLTTETAKIKDLTADELSAATAYIATLKAGSITAESLTADVAKVHNLTADQLSAAAGYISQLTADSVTAQNISAMYGDFATVKANAAKVANLTVQELEADHATIASLDSNYAHITNGVIDNATISYADVDNLSANYAQIQNGKINSALIDTAAIVDEQVFTVTGNKATLASIDASKINVTNLNADNITVNKINGQTVTGKSISDALTQHETDISTKVDTTTFNNTVEGLNDRIDGAIETFTGTVVPTLNNTPASAWNTTKLRDEHVGDVYYVVNASSQQNGYCYRFTKSGSTYSWQLIKDSDVTAALSRLQTAEGKITTFDSDISTLKTDTGELKTKTQSLETSLGDKVDVTTFNELSSDVEENSATITTLSNTVSQKADSSTVTTLSNTVNQVKQTADTNKTSITNLTQTVNQKADSSTVTTLAQRTSTIEQNLSGITTRVGETESALETVSNPNLTPWFSQWDDDYWRKIGGAVSESHSWTDDSTEGHKEIHYLGDGWAHVVMDSRSSAGNQNKGCYINTWVSVGRLNVAEGKQYTWLAEVRNLELIKAASSSVLSICPSIGNETLDKLSNVNASKMGTDVDTEMRCTVTAKDDFSALTLDTRGYMFIPTGCYAEFDVRVSLYEGEYEGPYKPYVDQTLSNRVKSAETSITQNAEAITLRATKTEAYQVAQPNLSPFFSMDFSDVYDASTNPNGYWHPQTSLLRGFTKLEDGWAHFSYTNSGSSPYFPKFWVTANAAPYSLKPSTEYTFLLELRNWSAGDSRTRISVAANNATLTDAFAGSITKTIGTTAASEYRISATTEADITGKVLFNYAEICVYPGDTVSCDMRLSLYEGEYEGPYKPYSGTQLYASQAELKVANDAISARVEKDGVIAAINASVEEEGGSAVKIQANHVEIDGTAVFNAISSDVDSAITGKGYQTASQVNTAITSKGYATTTQVATAKSEAISAAATDATNKANAVQENLDNLQIGGRNLLLKSADLSKGAPLRTNLEVSRYSRSSTFVDVDGKYFGVSISATSWQGIYAYVDSLDLSVGDFVTFSCRIRTTNITGTVWYYTMAYNSSGTRTYPSTKNASSAEPTFTPGSSKKLADLVANTDIGVWLTMEWTQEAKTALNNGDAFRMSFQTYADLSGDGAVIFYAPKLEKGTKATDWTPAPEDVAADSVKRTQRIYYRKEVTGAPAAPSSWVVSSGDGSNAWTQKHISISSTDKYIYTCEQYEMADGTLGNTAILLDDTITVIDGGKILTGTVEANALKANSLTLGQISTDAQNDILNSNVQVGSRNLLRKTSTLEAEDCVMVRTTVVEPGVFQIKPTTSAAYFKFKANYLDYADYGDGEYTLSCEAKLADVETSYTSINLNFYIGYSDAEHYDVAFANNTYHRYVGIGGADSSNPVTDSWQRFSVTFNVPERLTTGSLILADGVYLSATLYCPGSRKPVLVRHVKLEKGNKASDWTPAPEDVDNSIFSTRQDFNDQIDPINESIETLSNGITDQGKRLAATEDLLAQVKNMVDNLENTTSWLNFNEDNGLIIGDNPSDGSSFFYTQQKGSFMSFNQMTSTGSQQLMMLSGTNGVEAQKVKAEEVVTSRISSDWAISLEGDMFSIDYIGS